MTTKFLVAQTFGFLGIIINILSMQFKTRKNILTMLFLLNFCSALNFHFLDRTAACAIKLFGCLEILINSGFEARKKELPVWLVTAYVVYTIFLGMVAYNSIVDLLLILGSVLYCCTLLMIKEQNNSIELKNKLSHPTF